MTFSLFSRAAMHLAAFVRRDILWKNIQLSTKIYTMLSLYSLGVTAWGADGINWQK